MIAFSIGEFVFIVRNQCCFGYAAGFASLLQQMFSLFIKNDGKCAYILPPIINQLQHFSCTIGRIITDEDCDRVWESVARGIEMMAEEQADD